MSAAYLAVGLVLLMVGADVLVRGASRLAARCGISPLIVGLTVVAFGTSAPETAVSVQAAWSGSGDIAVGNVVGSNIANVLLILGLSALIAPLIVSNQLIRLDVPIMIGASALVMALAWDGSLARLEGGLLFAGVIAYTAFLLVQSRRHPAAAAAAVGSGPAGAKLAGRPVSWAIDAAFVVGGLVLLVAGSKLLVTGATQLARALGLSELVIGLTVIALGTSLPELATSIMAAVKGERDIAVGNIVGSNIFNLLCVLGLASLVSPSAVQVARHALTFDLPIMLAVAVACLPIFFTGHAISRWEGGAFVGFYALYTAHLVMAAADAPDLALLSAAMVWFVLPLTVITLVVVVARAWRSQRA